jgi:hypothetical protein
MPAASWMCAEFERLFEATIVDKWIGNQSVEEFVVTFQGASQL